MLDLFDLENITVLGMYRKLGAVFVRLKRRRAARRKHLSRSRPFSIKKVIDLFHQISPFFANTEILFCCVTLLSPRKNNWRLNIHFDCSSQNFISQVIIERQKKAGQLLSELACVISIYWRLYSRISAVKISRQLRYRSRPQTRAPICAIVYQTTVKIIRQNG